MSRLLAAWVAKPAGQVTPGEHSGPVPAVRRLSLWLIAAAMLQAVGLKSVPPVGAPWVWGAGGCLLVGLGVAYRDRDRNWWRTAVLLAYVIITLHLTRIDGDTSDAHVLELAVKLGLGLLVVPALVARRWLREPLDYRWQSGRWSGRMVAWIGVAVALAFALLWLYFHVLTPTLYRGWFLPPPGSPRRSEAMWRLFWGCNLVGAWDELCFINVIFVLLHRRIGFKEANAAQAVFFTSFLYKMAFVGWGPLIIGAFALIQAYTYKRTHSLLYIMTLHLLFDSVLFYMIVNRWYPGWGWRLG
jgi:hypothetical protein